jgi:seryl-tRNA(Sec) selenium transferase
MVGVVAAVRRWVNLNHEDRLATAEEQSRAIISPLQGIPGVAAELITNVIGHQPFGVELHVDPAVAGMTAEDVVERLKAGDPPIWTRVREGEDYIIMHVFGLSEGQDTFVGQRIASLFGK